jgi:hypothetical protein
MTTWFGILNLASLTLQDERFAIGLDHTQASALWTGELSLTGLLLSPLREITARAFPSKFVPDFDRQIFDFQKRPSFSERRFFFLQKLLDKALNPFS